MLICWLVCLLLWFDLLNGRWFWVGCLPFMVCSYLVKWCFMFVLAMLCVCCGLFVCLNVVVLCFGVCCNSVVVVAVIVLG